MIKTNTIRSQRHDPKVANLQLNIKTIKIKIHFESILQVQSIHVHYILYAYTNVCMCIGASAPFVNCCHI